MAKQLFDVHEERDRASDLLIELGMGTLSTNDFQRRFSEKAF